MSVLVWFHLLWMLLSFHHADAQLVRCDMPADVIFLLDASASIEPFQWEQEKDFVGILIDSLAVERHAINVGLIVYSTEIGQVIDLQPYKTKEQLKAIIPTLIQTQLGTDTAMAIGRMRQMIQNQAREGAKRIGVVITDGRSDNSTQTIQEAIYARQVDRVMMFALGVGNETYIDELEEIAKSDYVTTRERLFTVRDFSQLQGVVEELRNLICTAVPITEPTTTTTTTTTQTTPIITAPYLPPISCPRPADVVFLVDGSYSITPTDWAVGRVFVSALVQSLSVDLDAIHAGIIVYSSDIGDTVALSPFQDKVALQTRVTGLNQPPLGRTNTALGLRAVRTMFSQQGRVGVPHIGIVITDGKSSNVQQTIDEARLAKSADGIAMLVVGVGQDTLDTELRAMATSAATLFNVTDFSALFDIAEALTKIICIVIDETTTTTTTTPHGPTIPDLCKECLVDGGIGYNSHPTSCTQYAVCYPEENGGYRAVIKDCPFGLFWSSHAVACADSAFVNCSSDPCQGRPDGWSHTTGTKGCGEYWVCRGGRSLPQCCPQGQRYTANIGCFADSNCVDLCSLKFTIAGSGACPYRMNPKDPFSFLLVQPGMGDAVRPCAPGTVYNHDLCACVFNTPSLGCVPSLHYKFDGTFDERSKHKHTTHVHRVLLTKNNTAYFNGTGRVQVDTLPSNEFKDNFHLRIRYRVQPEVPPLTDLQWNDNKFGLQEWFTLNQRQNFTFSGGHQTLPLPPGPAPELPGGQSTSTLDQVIILKNGTVVHTGTGTGEVWPPSGGGAFVSRVYLGPIADTQETAVAGGVVYVPNGQGHLLILHPKTPSAVARWEIVTKDGQPVASGNGQIPEATAATYKFQLRQPPTVRWYILTSTGTVLRSGTGDIPDSVKNLYAGFTSGKLLIVDQIGDEVVQWKLSRPDGSGASGGKGSIPPQIRQDLKLDVVLQPEEGVIRMWAILADNGEVLQAGSGQIPDDVFKKYGWMGSGMVMTDTGAGHWSLQRPDGSKLVEGQGALPSSISSLLEGSVFVPATVKSTWSVVLPNGTRLNGEGPVPAYIQKLFEQASASAGAGTGTPVQTVNETRWYVMDSAGKVVESGFGNVPQDLTQRYGTSSQTKIVQQLPGQGSNVRRWEVRGQNGQVVASGEGQPPPDIFQVTKGQEKITMTVPVDVKTGAAGTLTSGANYPGYRFGAGSAGVNQIAGSPSTLNSASSSSKSEVMRQWTITLPDGSVRSGFGDIPADLARVMSSPNVRTTRRWSATLPDGTERSGEGDVPQDIQALIRGDGAGGSAAQNSAGAWSSNWQSASQSGNSASGAQQTTKDNTANSAASSSQAQTANSQVISQTIKVPPPRATMPPIQVQTNRRWTVTMPDGTTRSGTGDLPADLQALLDAQQSGQQQQGGEVKTTSIQTETQSGPKVQREWSITLPNGTVRVGTGDIPADLQTILEAQRAAGNLRTQTRWSVTMPDGQLRSGVGEIPADVQEMLSRGPERRWRLRMPDGSVKSGRGALPADIATLMESGSQSRARRAAPVQITERFHDLLGNCAGNTPPSYLLTTSDRNVRLTLRTSAQTAGTTLTLPISPGMNDVEFVYNGKALSGFSNGVQKSLPLSGSLLPVQAPLVIGDCSLKGTAFRGEIDEVSVSSCIP